MMNNNILWGCFIIACVLFFSCAELRFSSIACIDGDKSDPLCHEGKTDMLASKSVDVLFVMNNSEDMQKFNVPVTANLGRFLECIKPADWRVGFLSTVNKETVHVGDVMPLESNGQLSSKKFLQSSTQNYKALFTQTVSLSSGCSLPPYCAEEGKSASPLVAVKTFMEAPEEERSFLRQNTPLTVVFVSLSDDASKEDEEDDSDDDATEGKVTAEQALSSVQSGYEGDIDKFMHFTITDPGTYEDCTQTMGDQLASGISEGSNKLAGVGAAAGMMMANPVVLLGSIVLGSLVSSVFETEKSAIQKTKSLEMSRLTTLTGGRVLNLCHPAFGQALAYSVLEHIEMEDRLDSSCTELKKPKEKEKLSDKIELE